jgi:4-hydroxy-3-methylbut-2-enyl diphosphate reductase
MITAGASAPESVVQECVALLRWKFGGSVELQSVREEQVRFTLPVMAAT